MFGGVNGGSWLQASQSCTRCLDQELNLTLNECLINQLIVTIRTFGGGFSSGIQAGMNTIPKVTSATRNM
jgi:hypothetical protein